MRANGEDIRDWAFEPFPVSITHSLAFEEIEARIAAGLSEEEYLALPGRMKWADPENPTRSKSEIVMRYRLHKLIEAVQADAQVKKQKREARPKLFGR